MIEQHGGTTDNRKADRLRAEIQAGVNDYYEDATSPRLGESHTNLDAENAAGKRYAAISSAFRSLDEAVDTLPNSAEAQRHLLAKWAAMVDLAKSYGVNDRSAADFFSVLVIAKILQDKGSTLRAEHEHNFDDDDNNWFDVLRIVHESLPNKPSAQHISQRTEVGGKPGRVPDMNTPVPIIRDDVVQEIENSIPTTYVDRPPHDRTYHTAETELLWRITARAEYLTVARKLLRAGVNVQAIADQVLVNPSGVTKLIKFLSSADSMTPIQLAEAWGGEPYVNHAEKQPIAMALGAQDAMQQEIRHSTGIPR